MKIRHRFSIYNILLSITPIVLIGVISLLSLIMLIVNVKIVNIIFIWALLCIISIIISTTLITKHMASSIEKPIHELHRSVDNICSGDLSFEVMGSEYDEINDLCEGFDEMRRTLYASKIRNLELQNEQNLLIANISHDLKTPVTAIKGYIDGINDGIADTPEKMQRYLNTIRSKADVIEGLVNNLSLAAKLDTKKTEFTFNAGDIRELIYDIIDSYRIDFEQCGAELTADIADYPIITNIDGEKMRRVFSNIIDNSLKYRSADNPKLHIRAFIDNDSAYIQICDNGLGIAPEELSSVFDSFYRTDRSRTSQIKGNGLGLGIAKSIVTRHNGHIWLKSDGLNKGVEATISLPLYKEANVSKERKKQ